PVEEIGHAAAAVRGQELLDSLAREVAEFGVAQHRAGGAVDLHLLAEQPVCVKRAERRNEHALGEVPRGAEQQQSVGRGVHSLAASPMSLCMSQCECGCFMSKVTAFW